MTLGGHRIMLDSAPWPGGLITLRAGTTRACVAPGVGANCVAFDVGGQAVLEPVPSPDNALAGPAAAGCPVLFPFPGRLVGGRYRLDGHDYDLPLNAPDGLAHSHGFASRHPWLVRRQDETSCECLLTGAALTPEEARAYPWPFTITLTWRVRPGVLRAAVRVENPGSAALPFGFGLHPYLVAQETTAIRVPARQEWPNSGGVCTGPPRPTRDTWAWSALSPGASILLTDLPQAIVTATVGPVAIRFPGEQLGEVVLYRPPRRAAVCVEPWTSVSGAAATTTPGAPHGLVMLPPDAAWQTWVELGTSRE
jgi:aldose 1-epimerase